METNAVQKVDIKLVFTCNNRCSFCVQGDKRFSTPARDWGRIAEDLEQGFRNGARSLVLTGGEPTLQPRLLDAARLARTIGYSVVQIQSNGRRFFYRDFCRACIDAGANEFSPALHGSCPEIHDSLTRAPGSFLQTLHGIRNLKELGQTVIANTVITAGNYQDLPLLAGLLVSLEVDQFQFAFVHVLGEARKNASWLVPRKSAAAPFIQEGLRIGREAGVRCFTEAIPYCFMKEFEDCIAEKIIPQTLIFDGNNVIPDYNSYRHTLGKTKGPQCRICRYFTVCEGPWKEYPELFGWDEFFPIAAP